ncbi:MAG: DEAD/DEAH box helicase family protein [Fibromonadaceae bacterium]|jgi:ATP-dependent helicase HepA|nr:DEAD/DEAH box helicase family protein [Fibromonadaceae bacterium]
MVPKFTIGQKWTSYAEPELGVGQIIKQDFRTISLLFPVSGECRTYSSKGEPPLKRYILKMGEKATSVKGNSLFVEEVEEENGLLYYKSKDKRISEDLLSFKSQSSDSPSEIFDMLLEKKFSSNFDFCLRESAAKLRGIWKSSMAKGLLKPRLRLLPHQLYLAFRASRAVSLPRLMLSDEVGLGKTIESGLIWNALQTEGKIKRTLLIVPEQLKNQWIIEFGKKFNHWFSSIDDDYISEHRKYATAEQNVFLLHDTVICSLEFLLANKFVATAALDVPWDLLIIDEAHRLVKTSQGTNAEYILAEQLSQKIPGLLLLSGTPIQLAPEAYFYRLKLIDSARFQNWEEFEKNQDNYKKVANDLSKISLDSDEELSWEDLQKNIPKKSPIRSWLPIKADLSLTAEEWMSRVIDALGTGSSVFRNTRKSVKGFPKRILKTYPFERDSQLKSWLSDFVEEHKKDKILLICSKSNTVNTLLSLLTEDVAVAFKEEETSLERDKAAAAWMRPDGPNVLLSSEIGSEGRNFQSARHLVLFDLPEDSSLLEQRIGRLDRIGQGAEIYIHVPFAKKSKAEMLYLWYHEALGIFEHSLMGGGEMYAKFEIELKSYLENPAKKFNKFLKEFLPLGKKEMQLLNEKAEAGRDRLLEFNSQNKKISGELLAAAQKMDSNEELLAFAFDMLSVLDIEVQNGIYPGSFVLKGAPGQSEHATLLGVSPAGYLDNGEVSEFDGCSITVATSRENALNYENVEFFHWEHPIMQRLFDKALSDDFGNVACVVCDFVPSDKVFVQYNFILEFSVNSHWGINNLVGERLLSVVLDNKGNAQNIPETLQAKQLQNSKAADISYSVLEYFTTEGFEMAKSSLEHIAKKISEETEKTVIPVLESEIHRLEETYMLLRDFELGRVLDKKKKDIIVCKKSLKNPKLRLNGVRVLVYA